MGVWQGDSQPVPVGVGALDMGIASISRVVVHCANSFIYALMMLKISIFLCLVVINLIATPVEMVMLIPEAAIFICLVFFQIIGIFITWVVRTSIVYHYWSSEEYANRGFIRGVNRLPCPNSLVEFMAGFVLSDAALAGCSGKLSDILVSMGRVLAMPESYPLGSAFAKDSR